jgi:hypothetical protein
MMDLWGEMIHCRNDSNPNGFVQAQLETQALT